ncbi:hypothetical protein [Mobiluncus porci]|uniref:Uncharacterized protein n=1 Tax=Mobiluncus porci TaxID=2652278 RepID=A0A7K0K250_9ACTO|nr:hypothetical protein [Mobiluncus porci]MST49499.1 hypothetical protein [Mobiluncus porci]
MKQIIELPPWEGATVEGNDVTPLENSTPIIDLPYLQPGRRYTLQGKATAAPKQDDSQPFIIMGESLAKLTPNTPTEFTVSTTVPMPVKLSLVSVASVAFERLELSYERYSSPDDPLPYDELGIDVYTTRPGRVPFILGTSRISVASLDWQAPTAGTFIIGSTPLDEGRLFIPDPPETWRALAPDTYDLEISRGQTYNGLIPLAQAASVKISVKNTADPRAWDIIKNRPLRVYTLRNMQPVFTGHVTETALQLENKADYTVTIAGTDLVGELVQMKRYGVRETGIIDTGETFTARLARLLTSGGYPYTPPTTDPGVMLCNTVLESSIAKHLDLACNSIGGAWYVNRAGEIVFQLEATQTAPGALYSDQIETQAFYFVEVSAVWNSKDLISLVDVLNKAAQYDPERQDWQALETTTTGTNQEMLQWHGPQKAVIETCLQAQAARQALADRLAATKTAALTVSNVTLNATRYQAYAGTAEIGDLIEAHLRGEKTIGHISHITHKSDAWDWMMEIELAGWKQKGE